MPRVLASREMGTNRVTAAHPTARMALGDPSAGLKPPPYLEGAMKGGADAVVPLQGAVRPDFIIVQARCPVVTKEDKSRGGLGANRARSSPMLSCPQHQAGLPQPLHRQIPQGEDFRFVSPYFGWKPLPGSTSCKKRRGIFTLFCFCSIFPL